MRILFVCSGNAHRSPLAEALLKKLRPDLEVDSAGIHVAIPISNDAKGYLKKEGAEQYLKRAPEDVESKQLEEYDLIITMEQMHENYILRKCPSCKDKTVTWDIEDPYMLSHEDAKRVYEEIKRKVTKLAETS